METESEIRDFGRRLFFAINLPAEVKAQLADLQSRLKIGCRFVDAHPKWVETDNLHLTLLFMGSVDEERIADIARTADVIAGQMEPIELLASRLGLFPPDSKDPKVLSVDVRGIDKGLQRLHARLHNSMSDLGLDLENRPYRPHLTLARITSIKTASRLAPLAASHANKLSAKFPVTEFVLFESHLSQQGSTYHVLHTATLSA